MISCIRGQDRIFQRTIGDQKPTGAPLRWSRFVLREETEGGTLLFNALNRILVFCDRPEAALADPAALPPEDADQLRAWHFLVPESRDEMRFAEQMNSILRLVGGNEKSEEQNTFTIFTTTACNARCPYCFEAGYRSVSMTRETADAVVDFMIASAGGKEIRIGWFGGEPLVNAPIIDHICAALRERGSAYRSRIITNGYLWTPELIRRAAEDWKLVRAQITLDGTEEVYNATKNYISPVGSPYRRVLDNIEGLLDAGVAVNVRLNLSLENAENLLTLSEELRARFGSRKLFHVYTYLLFEYLLASEGRPLSEVSAPLEAYRKLSLRLEEQGHGVSIGSLDKWAAHCLADSDGNFVIAPDGRLVKCEHYFDREIVGDVTHGVTDWAMLQSWKERTPKEEQCESCPIYPACIRLKKCPDEPQSCSALCREIRLLDAHNAMRSAWRRKCANIENKEESERYKEDEHR